jgi:GNAT superfamily N-acetyltransferase
LGDIKPVISKIQIIENAPSAEEFNALRNSLGWITYPFEDTTTALESSLYCICVYENNSLIGMGRIVGDTCLCFYVQDVAVAPNKQRQGIGSIIMNHIMRYLHNNAVNDAYIGLMSKKGVASFYQKHGFVERPNPIAGPGMTICDFTPMKV